MPPETDRTAAPTSAKRGQLNNCRKLFVALCASALTTPLESFAQQPAKIPHIGFQRQTRQGAGHQDSTVVADKRRQGDRVRPQMSAMENPTDRCAYLRPGSRALRFDE